VERLHRLLSAWTHLTGRVRRTILPRLGRRAPRTGVVLTALALLGALVGPVSGAGRVSDGTTTSSASVAALERHPSGPQPLPAGVRPTLARAAGDWEVLEGDGCTLQELGVEPKSCVFGDLHGRLTVALVGDSHAAQWFPALDQIARQRGWRLVTFTKLACRFVDMRIYSRTLKREYTECERWRTIVVSRLVALRPDLVIVGSSEGMAPILPADGDPTRQGVAMARLLSPVRTRIAVLVDTPWWTQDVPTCIAAHVHDLRPCELSRAVAVTWQHLLSERAAVAASRATLVDMTDAICPYDPCPVVLNGMIIYRDSFHLTATFSASLASRLAGLLPRL
jgi:SGNH domain (fused to AT3 domains)